MYPIKVYKEFTATNTNMLSGTELDTPPYSGILRVWVASTVNTATIECPQGGSLHKTGVTNVIEKFTDGRPDISKDACYIIPVTVGQIPKLILGGTTGTVGLLAILSSK